MQNEPILPNPPPTLWEYYKRIKASGFLPVFRLLYSTLKFSDGSVRIASFNEFMRLPKQARLLTLMDPEQAHYWPAAIQEIRYRWDAPNTVDPDPWQDARHALLRDACCYFGVLSLRTQAPKDLTKVGF